MQEVVTFTVESAGGGGGGGGGSNAPTIVSSEVTTQGDVSITLNKEMADQAGKHAQLTVKVDDVDDVVTGAALTSDPKKIKLTLSTKVTGGQAVTVAYTKDADETKQIKATDGGVLETFGAMVVSNNL